MNLIEEKAERVQELDAELSEAILDERDLLHRNADLFMQNKRYHNLLESLSDTHDIASEIMKKHPDKKIIDANDILQYILRKINDELERVS